jgi:hypothetical protein
VPAKSLPRFAQLGPFGFAQGRLGGDARPYIIPSLSSAFVYFLEFIHRSPTNNH